MNKFKVGDIVKSNGKCGYSFDPIKKGIITEIVNNKYQVKVIDGCNEKKRREWEFSNSWTYCENELELLEESSLKEKLKKIIVYVPTQEDWDYVVGVIEGFVGREFCFKEEFNNLKSACIRITDINDINCGSLSNYREGEYSEYIDHKIISFQEFKELIGDSNSNNNKTMTFQEQLYKYLEHGAFVPVVDCYNEHMIFCPSKDDYGYYRASCWCNNLDEAKKTIGCCDGYIKEDINKTAEKDNWKILHNEVFKLTPEKMFKVDDNVRILDSIKKTDDWDDYKDDLKDMSGVICDVCNNISGARYLINNVCIGAEYVVQYFEDEEVKEMTVADVEKLVGKKVKIIKE